MSGQRDPRSAADKSGFFVPDLCNVQSVLLLVLVAELLALMFSVAGPGLERFSWQRFATTSLFLQWIVLLSAAGLCQLRQRIGGWPRSRAAALCYAWVLAVTALVSVAAQWLLGAFMRNGVLSFDYWSLLDNLLISAVLAGIALRYFYLAQELRQRQRAELEARIQALQARIRPHFLFNSMNSIASLIGSDAAAAERAVEDLAELFRATLSQTSAETTWAEELETCRRYLRIEQLRLGARLRVEWRVEALPAALPIPALSLQPLLENAIYHGIQMLPEGGCIEVSGHYADALVAIEVRNPMPPPQAAAPQRGNRMALDNVARRLRALYGDEAGMAGEQQGDHFVARLFYPRQYGPEPAGGPHDRG